MLLLSLIFLLLSNAVTLRRDKSILYSRIGILILLFTILLTINSLHINALNKGIGLYGGLYHVTSITHIFHVFIFILSAIVLQLTGFYPRKIWTKKYLTLNKLLFYKFIFPTKKIFNKTAEQFKIIEYPLIILFTILGTIFLISTSNLVSIFLSIELQSYGLYLLSTIYRNSELATSAGLTYFLLGGLSSCFILLGASLLYINSGTTDIEGLYIISNMSNIFNANSEQIFHWYNSYYIDISLLIMSVGFLFKVSAAPFHFWSPDVYDSLPTVVTTFVAVIGKISIFIFILQLVHFTGKSLFFTSYTWITCLLISSLLSLIIGTIVGLTQSRIKRLYAYSTISHIGFILLALSINSVESIQAFIFYLIQYSISNLNAFFLLVSIGFGHYYLVNKNNSYYKLQDKNNSPVQYISQIKGYFYINPIIALSLSITLFSFVGVPPLIGFFAKQMILSAALDNGYIFMTFIAILTSVISAVYYLAIVKQIFFEKPLYSYLNNYSVTGYIINYNNTNIEKILVNNITISGFLSITISILTLIILLFIFIPQEWWDMTNILALIVFDF